MILRHLAAIRAHLADERSRWNADIAHFIKFENDASYNLRLKAECALDAIEAMLHSAVDEAATKVAEADAKSDRESKP